MTGTEGRTQEETAEVIGRFAPERLAVLRAHPRFEEALRHSAEGALALHAAMPRMSGVLKDMGRFWVGVLCTYLHATGGMTLARVREVCALTGLMSPNAAEALLAHMRDLGFVIPAADQPDKRSVVLEITPELLAYFRARQKIEVEAVAMLDPRLAPVLAQWDTSWAMEAFMRIHGRDFLTTVPTLTAEGPELAELFARNAGPLMILRLMVSGGDDDRFPPERPVRLSMNALAGEFEVSRTHVARFIADAEAGDFLRRANDGRSVSFTDRFREQFAAYGGNVYLEWIASREPALALLAEREAAG